MCVLRSTAVILALIMMSAPEAAFGQAQSKILPRDRPQFVINCLDGASEQNQPSVIAPEYQELAAKKAKEKERVDNCQRQASEQKVLPRDRPQFVINCLDK